FVRIVLAMIREDYEEIDYYYSLYDSMIRRVGLEDMIETSEGLYVIMQVLREFMGGFSLTKSKLQYPGATLALLSDIAKHALQFDEHDNAWQLVVTSYKIGVAYGREEGALASFLELYKISSSSHDRYKPALEKIAEHALKMFLKKGWDTSQITPILNEIQGNIPPIEDMTTKEPTDIESLPEELRSWMDVLSLETMNDVETLLVRNDKLQVRVGIDIMSHPELGKLKTGHKVALTKGSFSLMNATPDLIKDFAVMLMVTPAENAEISYEGEFGFSWLKIAEPETEA
ncbi:MAG: hypothetical protein ACFFD6_07125, partial [Candidatus Thorarchaeota archaeon]